MASRIDRLMKLWSQNTETSIFIVDGRLRGYEDVGNWLVTATKQGVATVMRAEPLARPGEDVPSWVKNDEGFGGCEGELGRMVGSRLAAYFADRRSELLLSDHLGRLGYASRPVGSPGAAPSEGFDHPSVEGFLARPEAFAAFLSAGGYLRLSMRLDPRRLVGKGEPASCTVRRYRVRHGGSLSRLCRWYDGRSVDLEEWNHGWEARYTLVSAEASCSVRGFCLAFPGHRVGLKPGLGVIGDMYVEPESRRCGIGRSLLLEGIRRLSRFKEIRLGISLPNPPALHLYLDSGFTADSVEMRRSVRSSYVGDRPS